MAARCRSPQAIALLTHRPAAPARQRGGHARQGRARRSLPVPSRSGSGRSRRASCRARRRTRRSTAARSKAACSAPGRPGGGCSDDPRPLAAPSLLGGAASWCGYLLGSIPFGLLLTRSAGLGDIRAIGSGNIGATNVLRTGRKGLAAATLLLDAARARSPCCSPAGGGREAMLVAGLGAVLGHLFPVWLRFRGGKGVATGLGVLIATPGRWACSPARSWLVRRRAAAALLARHAVGDRSRRRSLAWWLRRPRRDRARRVIAVLVWARHHANIRRLLAGTEPRIGAGR